MKIYVLMKIVVEGYYSRYYTPMIDTGAEANLCRYNCLPESKWDKLKTPIIVKGFNNEGNLITYKARNVKIQVWDIELQVWIEKTLENLDKSTCDSLHNLKSSLREEQHKIINNIENLELDIHYSTDRINYYTRICNSAITTR